MAYLQASARSEPCCPSIALAVRLACSSPVEIFKPPFQQRNPITSRPKPFISAPAHQQQPAHSSYQPRTALFPSAAYSPGSPCSGKAPGFPHANHGEQLHYTATPAELSPLLYGEEAAVKRQGEIPSTERTVLHRQSYTQELISPLHLRSCTTSKSSAPTTPYASPQKQADIPGHSPTSDVRLRRQYESAAAHEGSYATPRQRCSVHSHSAPSLVSAPVKTRPNSKLRTPPPDCCSSTQEKGCSRVGAMRAEAAAQPAALLTHGLLARRTCIPPACDITPRSKKQLEQGESARTGQCASICDGAEKALPVGGVRMARRRSCGEGRLWQEVVVLGVGGSTAVMAVHSVAKRPVSARAKGRGSPVSKGNGCQGGGGGRVQVGNRVTPGARGSVARVDRPTALSHARACVGYAPTPATMPHCRCC